MIMASDYLLEIEGIQGEAQDKQIKNAIEIASFSGGVTHPGSMAMGTGGSTGQSSFSDLSLTSTISKASPNIAQYCATGKHVGKVTLHVRKATGDGGQQEYLTYELTDAMISSYMLSGAESSEQLPMESYSFNFAKIKVSYRPQNTKTGALDPAVEFTYDIKARSK
jgi:type VI secretion system secreted protein Hcp